MRSLPTLTKAKWLLLCCAVILLVTAGTALYVAPRWPYRKAELIRRLEDATGSRVEIGRFHQTFFPHPGCVAENLTLTNSDPAHPKITVQKVTVSGLYSGLIGSEKHIRMLSLEGMRIAFPPQNPESSGGQNDVRPQRVGVPSGIKFDQVEARNSQIVFARKNPEKEPRTFAIYDVILKSFAPGEAIHFNAVLRIPVPPAEVNVDGVFGPLTGDAIGKAQLKGRFTMKNADLSKFHALMGTLSAQGQFEGQLEGLTVNATTNVPDFGTKATHHTIPLNTDFTAVVDGTNGDVQFQPVHALLGETKLIATGKLEEVPDANGKRLTLHIASQEARIQDLMVLFTHSKPPLQGATRFDMSVQLPPDKKPFEERLQATAHFGIRGSKFSKQQTEQKVSDLSQRAQGNTKDDDPPPVMTDLSGDVNLAGGTANFSRLDISIPGASAALHGTYKLETHAVDLHGMLHTDANLSDATTGFKAFLMKVVELAKKKNKNGATVPVKITGSYERPDFGLDAPAEK
ncbi:hypothetical protein Acid345_3294 [Candidatus Koribacter versatilis Ellin345]|uniref:Uncharacterized protein n=1 Tax=Koribacter versatilis (strain Ellin345) TaxID=204669 RepID=Q1ILF5_KORVE|nr:AsmA-like C-terminal region-containing protein [Candidatus Koribacter versatilis]ABF42295.1 hypothetical protein Acid345_3294 [Candidatus Koribacter versatilis Ellin345]